jgi:hypothetical protein
MKQFCARVLSARNTFEIRHGRSPRPPPPAKETNPRPLVVKLEMTILEWVVGLNGKTADSSALQWLSLLWRSK